jgi:hypothetical protein
MKMHAQRCFIFSCVSTWCPWNERRALHGIFLWSTAASFWQSACGSGSTTDCLPGSRPLDNLEEKTTPHHTTPGREGETTHACCWHTWASPPCPWDRRSMQQQRMVLVEEEEEENVPHKLPSFPHPHSHPRSVNGCFYCACSPAPLRPNPSSMGIGCSCTHVISVNY